MKHIKTIQQLKVINALYLNSGANIQTLSNITKMNRVTVSNMLNGLNKYKLCRVDVRQPNKVNVPGAVSKHYCLTDFGINQLNPELADLRVVTMCTNKINPLVNDLEWTQRTKNLVINVLEARFTEGALNVGWRLSNITMIPQDEWRSVDGFGPVALSEINYEFEQYCMKWR